MLPFVLALGILAAIQFWRVFEVAAVVAVLVALSRCILLLDNFA